MCSKSACFVKPHCRGFDIFTSCPAELDRDVRADNKVFCWQSGGFATLWLHPPEVTVTLRNRTFVIVPHADVQASLPAFKAGIHARDAASSRRLPAGYRCHASCNRAARVSALNPKTCLKGPYGCPGCLPAPPPPLTCREFHQR